MRGVGVALMLSAEAAHPTFGTIAVVLVAQVVDVSTFQMGERAEKSLLLHREHGLMERVVAAVLKHEAVAMCAFCGVDELPALGNRSGCGHFDGNVLALLHGIAGHGGVGEPVGAYVYQIDVVSFTQLAPSVVRVVQVGGISAIVSQQSLGGREMLGTDVTQGYNVYVLDDKVATQCSHTAIAQSDETYANCR